jgi:Ca2+-binding RTX toxin-like protein
MTIGLISAVVAIAIIIFAANVPIINAQQMTNQPTVSQNGTMLFQSTEDSFRLQVPDGWVIQDVNNTGSTLSNESTQGYAILAQLCPQEEQEEEEQAALSNVSGRGDTTTSCQGSEGDIIHIVRYPDLDTRLQVPNNITTNNGNLTIDNILSYHMQKLQEVGYRNITIVNSTYTAVNLTNPQTNQTVSIVPAQFVEIQYSSAAAAVVSSPNQIREGYFILTATNATAPNPGMTKGYSIFYEGTFTAPGAATVQTSTPLSGGGLPDPPAAVRQILDSFELIAAPEVIAQDMLAAQLEQAQEVVEEPTNPLIVEIISTNTEGGGGGGEAIAPATFEFEADVGGGTGPYTHSWDFDDESSSGGEESDGQIVVHMYNEPGAYTVSLTVTDANGRQTTDTLQITVNEPPPPPPTTCEGETATIVGTPGNDNNIVGTSGRDVIAALGGDDRIRALDGNDLVCGGGGNDVIDGGQGNNRLFGDEPNEEEGTAGADRIEGGTGSDFIDGGAGNDVLDGSTGNDEVHGSMGSDRLVGFTGNDQLFGEDNDDVLDGGSDNDQLNGGAGNDVLDGGGDIDNGDGGPNFDRCVRVETITNCEA